MEEKTKVRPPEPKPLPADFYRQMLGVPPCKTGQPCNNCGKCQH